jgi:dihydropteroate synthase
MNIKQFSERLNQRDLYSNIRPPQKPLIMGIVNATSDSFSDGGKFLHPERACEHVLKMITEGADIIDVGGESTRPFAEEVSVDLELSRVIPVIENIRKHSDICLSIDTSKPEVMKAAIHAGADIINDVYALRAKGAIETAALLAVPVCLMHMQGSPKIMQQKPNYPHGVVSDIMRFFVARIKACKQGGIHDSLLILDPGFGYGKSVNDNLKLMYHLELFHEFNLPLLLGVSRKSTIGTILSKEVDERLIGGLALAVYAAQKRVGIIRTHDVDETNQALTMIEAIGRQANRGDK